MVSRNGNTFASFHQLATEVAADFRGQNGILDGEIVSLDEDGHPQFKDLMFRHGELFFVAFDALVSGEDLRRRQLIKRKRMLGPSFHEGVVHVFATTTLRSAATIFNRLVCENNLEGIVAKHRL